MRVNKITTGFVIQTYDTDTKEWISQEFVAGTAVDYENQETGEPLAHNDMAYDAVFDEYLYFRMVQPSQAYPDGDNS
jgi:hypothetical protein